MANRQRGEVEITLDDKSYTLAPTFGAIAEIEDSLGRPFLELAGEIIGVARDAKNQAEGKPTVKGISLTNCATIIAACARAGGHKVTREQIGDALVAEGMLAALGPLVELVSVPLAGSKGMEGNAEGPATGPVKRKSAGRKS